ncbi:hypothetical protein PC121_g2711 [Phytophthora cactorum]|nr:hypothetical protein PC121_g2711 [Phytophthora cactorum]
MAEAVSFQWGNTTLLGRPDRHPSSFVLDSGCMFQLDTDFETRA